MYLMVIVSNLVKAFEKSHSISKRLWDETTEKSFIL